MRETAMPAKFWMVIVWGLYSLVGLDALQAQFPRRQAPRPRPTEAERLAHFEKKIRPVLVARCYECHSTESPELKGGLALDSREGIRRGGDSGPAVVPGDARASLLMAAIRHEPGWEMPPGEQLSATEIADFLHWIETGAEDPRDTPPTGYRSGPDLETGRDFWAFQPPAKVAPPEVADADWPLGAIDRFILAAQQRHGIQAVADAPPHTLVRRLYFDLVGLPPTPDELSAFIAHWHRDPQATLEEAVDRLLDSPQFGERWGRHWLDVARYAESSGRETNFNYPQAWRYRDYVIEAFQQDLPYNDFVRQQIAGDLLPADSDDQRARHLIATGFLALGPKSHIERNPLQFQMDLVDEQIDAMTQVFLGLTVACARCHDHKFDPISQADYYALAGIFRSVETMYGTIPLIQNRHPSRLVSLPAKADVSVPLAPLSDRERRQLERQIESLREQRNALINESRERAPQLLRLGTQLALLEGRLASYEPDGTPKRLAMGVRDRAFSTDSPLYVRGEVERPAAVVPRGFVRVLSNDATPDIVRGSGRLELAEWMVADDNPLTARVMVNRVWLHLFGRGLVPTPDNLGLSGDGPSHPELLDYLAVTFREEGWSVKRLIRHIVLSRTYRLDSTWDERNFDLDPENRWLWRMTPRRLDAEAIRDAMLAMAGRLQLEPPVGSAVADGGEGLTAILERFVFNQEWQFQHRAVYLPAVRGRSFESLAVFDGVDGSMVVGQRPETTVPSQSLYLLNSPLVLSLSSAAARRLIREADDPSERIALAYVRWFGRPPRESERIAAWEFLDDYRDQLRRERSRGGNPELLAWSAFCQSLWSSADFLLRR